MLESVDIQFWVRNLVSAVLWSRVDAQPNCSLRPYAGTLWQPVLLNNKGDVPRDIPPRIPVCPRRTGGRTTNSRVN